jgi:glycosyltransferase involved in cell wall biosynthesis
VHYLPGVRLEAGGVARAVLDFCRVFASLGHEVTLATSDATDVPTEWREPGAPRPGLPRVALIDPPRGPLQRVPRTTLDAMAGLLRDADALHVHEVWSPSSLQCAGVARRAGVPYVVSIHGMLDDWSMAQKRPKKRMYLALAGNRLLGGAARVHCTARAELDQVRRWLPRDNGVVLPLVMDLADYAALPGPDVARAKFPSIDGDGWKLLFLSRVHPKKGVEVLIRAAAELRRRGRACRVLIAGPGEPAYVASLEALARANGIGDATHVLGMVRGAGKLSLYEAADVFVLPTSQENFGLVLVEALACGAPVVTTRGVDIWQELQAAGAEIVDARPAAVADAIERIMAADPAVRGRRGRDWVLENLDPARVAAGYVEMYGSIAGEGRPAGKLAR